MKLVLLSDLHLLSKNPVARLDDLVKTQIDKFEFVLNWTYEHNATILQAGDFFHQPRSWILLPKVIDLLNQFEEGEVPIYSIYGQHDTYFYSEATRESTSLGILEKIGYVSILNKDAIVDWGGVAIYGCSWGGEIPEPLDKSRLNILVIHAPIANEPLFPNHQYTPAKAFFDKHNQYDLILCGDIHRRFDICKDDRYLINTGPMLRLTAEEYSFKHAPSFAVYDTDDRTIEWVTIPHLDVEEVMSRKHLEQRIEADLMLDDFINSLKEGDIAVTGVSLKENIKQYIERNNINKGVQNILAEIMSSE